jgi:hypothetical protein
MTLFARQRFRSHHDPGGVEAFHGIARRDAIVGGDER